MSRQLSWLAELGDCETPDAEGSCSSDACPGSIEPEATHACTDG